MFALPRIVLNLAPLPHGKMILWKRLSTTSTQFTLLSSTLPLSILVDVRPEASTLPTCSSLDDAKRLVPADDFHNSRLRFLGRWWCHLKESPVSLIRGLLEAHKGVGGIGC